MNFSIKRSPLNFLAILLVSIALTAAFFSAAQAQSPTPSDDEVNAVARDMYCPVCENIPLDVCPTTACAQWRALIREKLAMGWTADQIKDYFATQYGDRVLSQPPARGLNWLVYILPPAFFLAGVFLVYRVLRTIKRKTPEAEPPAQTPVEKELDPYLSQLEAELENQRKSNK